MEGALKNPIQSHRQPFFESHIKTLQSGDISSSHAKAIGDSGGGDIAAQQAEWYRQAADFVKAVENGYQMTPEEQQRYPEMLTEMNWIYNQLWDGANRAPSSNGPPMVGGEDQDPITNEFGGELGPDGNFTYDMVQTNIGFTGKDTRNDVFGTQNTLSFDQPSAKASFEMTMDHGVQVLKVIVTTSKGKAVYYYDAHTSPEFALTVSMADPTKVSGLENLPADLKSKIKVEKFDPNKKPEEDDAQSTATGQPVEGKENEWYYKAEDINQTIDFHPKAGENETHYVVGNSTISLDLDASADVTGGSFNVNGSTYDYKIVVTNADKSTDTFYVKKPFNTHINAVEGTVSFDGTPADGTTVPDEFSENITLNVGDGVSGGNGGPDSVDAQQIIDDFISTAGLDNEDQLIAAFQAAGYTDFEKIDDVKKAIEKGDFPPKDPDQKLINLLASLDTDLKDAIEDVTKTATDNAGKDDLDSKVQEKMQDALDRLQELLQKLYPKSIVEVSNVTGPTFGSVAVGTLTIKNADGTSYSHQATLDPSSGDLII